MTAKKPCIEDGCSKPADGPRCPSHQQVWEAARGSRHARGYGKAHEAARRRLLRLWALSTRRGGVWACARCHEPLVYGEPVDADHVETTLWRDPAAVASALSHPRCNRGAREEGRRASGG